MQGATHVQADAGAAAPAAKQAQEAGAPPRQTSEAVVRRFFLSRADTITTLNSLSTCCCHRIA